MDNFGKYFHTVDKAANQYIRRNLTKGLDLNELELRIIRLIVFRGPKSQQMIANILGSDKATVARSLNHLEACGYLTRTTDPYDRRVKRVTATEAARELREELRSLEAHFYEWLCSSMSESEKNTLRSILLPLYKKADLWFLASNRADFDLPFSDTPQNIDAP